MKQHLKYSKLCLNLLGVFGMMATLPGVSLAQEKASLQRVEVTGSNIRRADAETPSPVQVITAEELAKSGYTTVNEVLQNLTANGAGTLGKGFSGAFATGASGISLRGLTVGATLVLIDGHRMAPYPLGDDAQRDFVDTSSIPFSAIERIEVLKDGASAIYGSDAVAGVVNVILKRSFTGTQMSAEVGRATGGGGNTRVASIIHGMSNDDGSKKGYLSLEVRHQDRIALIDRKGADWANLDWRNDGGDDLRPGAVGIVPSRRPVLLNTPILAKSTRPSLSNPADWVFLNSGCNFANWRASNCAYDNTWSSLQPESDNVNLLGRFEAKLSDDWDMRLTASRFQSKTKIENPPQAVPYGSFGGVSAFGPNTPPTPGVGAIASFLVPATYPGNTLGAPARVVGYLPAVSNRETSVESVASRMVAEFSGAMAGWDMDIAAGMTRVDTKQTFNGYVNWGNLYAALNNPSTPYLLTGGNSEAMNNFVSPTALVNASQLLNFLDVRGTRELMKLDGGALGIAAGMSYMYKRLDSPNAAERAAGTMSIPGSWARGDETGTAAFVEVSAPVTKQLELDGAVRFDNFRSYGNSTTPKVGFKFSPSNVFTVRGTAARGFRAPGAAENGEAGSFFSFNSIRDPLLCPVSNADGSPNLTAPGNVPAACSFNPAYSQSTSKTLEPEKSTSTTLGFIFEPTKDWSTTLDFYRIKMDGQIIPENNLPTFDPITKIVRGPTQIVTYGDGSSGMSPVGLVAYIPVGYVNANSTETNGVEFETRYKLKFEDKSRLTVGLQMTRMFSYKLTTGGVTYELAGTHGPSVVGGNTGNPRDRAALSFNYESGPFSITTTTNYVSGYDVTDSSAGAFTCEDALINVGTGGTAFNNSTSVPSKYCSVGSFTSTNLSATYQLSKGLTLRGAVTNLFNAQAPIDHGTYGGTGLTAYNPSLHQAGAIGRTMSVGVDYKF